MYKLSIKMCSFDARAALWPGCSVEHGEQSVVGNYFDRHFKFLQFSPTSTELMSRLP